MQGSFPIMFFNYHAFSEAVFGGRSLQKIFLLKEQTYCIGKVNNFSSRDFWGWERGGWIVNIESFFSLDFFFLKNDTSALTKKLFLAFLEELTSSLATLDCCYRRRLQPLELTIIATRDQRRYRSLPPLELAIFATRDWRCYKLPSLLELVISIVSEIHIYHHQHHYRVIIRRWATVIIIIPIDHHSCVKDSSYP